MIQKITIGIIFVLMSITSCRKDTLGHSEAHGPNAVFEEMWSGYDQWYGMFESRHINWDSLYKIYKPTVNNGMSDKDLYKVLCQLITPMNDPHAFIQPTTGGLPRYESNEFFRNNKVQLDFSIDLVRHKYLTDMVTLDDNIHYGVLPQNIGYLHLGEFGMPISFYKQKLPSIIEKFKETKGVIVDIRNHAGGSDEVSRYIAGLFTSETKLFMTVKKRNGPKHTNFTQDQNWYVEKQGSYQFTKPTVLLTTRWTVSAGETFVWAMKTQSHVTQMGDTTAGGFTDVISRELPNGWLYFVGVGDYRNARGKSDEGVGVVPDVLIRNTNTDIQQMEDNVMEKALSYLK